MNQVSTRGIILTRVDFGEADRILTFLSPDQGKLSLMAKGVRKSRSKLAGGIELFSESELSFIRGRGEVGTLTSARLIVHYGGIVKDLERTMLGYEFLKVINKHTEANAGPEYFELLSAALKGLNDVQLSKALAELWFCLQMLAADGNSPELKLDTAGQELAPDKSYSFEFEAGRFSPAASGAYGADHIKLLRLASRVAEPAKLAQVQGIEGSLPAVLQLARNLLAYA